MTITEYILLSLNLLSVSLAAAKIAGAPQAIIDELTAAITKLQSVQGTDVTWEQLQGLRTSAQW